VVASWAAAVRAKASAAIGQNRIDGRGLREDKPRDKTIGEIAKGDAHFVEEFWAFG
jgi:hypothetical protein